MEEQPWLEALIPFADSRDKRVLELGCGAGFDAYEFCRRGAIYTGIDITPENPVRTRAHLSLFGLTGDLREADAEDLPFERESFDVVFSNGVLHHTPDIAKAFREARRVLRPGGEFWVILYHRNSIFYWLSLGLFDHVLRGGFRRRSFRERLSLIEYTTSSELPIVNAYSRAEVARLLAGAGFDEIATTVRKLRPEDLPGVPLVGRLWHRIPQAWLDRLGKRFGWYVVARAHVPDGNGA